MSERNGTVGVTKLLGLGLTPGKLRGLQRISNPGGTLTMLALDQNNSIIKMASEGLKASGQNREPTYDEIVDAKLDLLTQMAPAASAVLVDAVYGARSAVAGWRLPRTTGLLVRVEKSGASKNRRGGLMGEVEPGWGVEKIKRMGADAVKLLVQFEPSEPESAEHQFKLVERIYDECRRHDILLLVETTSYELADETKESGDFNKTYKKTERYLKRKPETVIESARQISRYCDIYKAEFPGTLGHGSDGQIQENLKRLNQSSERPWVLLSAGVDYPDYEKQVGLALEAGASGVLGGRAFWKEYFTFKTPEERVGFARGEALGRLKKVGQMVEKNGQPWFARYGLSPNDLQRFRPREGWYHHYGQTRGAAGGTAVRDLSGDY